MTEIIYEEKPFLKKPYLILGFEGWPNAAEVSSFSLQFLIDHLKAKRFAAIPLEPFYQITSLRPTAMIRGGRILEVKSAGNHFYYKTDLSGKDFIFFYGTEPHQHWNLFARLILGLAKDFEVSKMFTVGGTYDYIPHTFPTMVSALFNSEDLRDEVVQADLSLTEYTGPISIHTFLLNEARKRGLPAISLWGHAPQYLQARNIKVVLQVLKKLARLTTVDMDFTYLERASDYFDQQVNEMVKGDPKLQEVISKLEEAYRRSERDLSLGVKEEEPREDKVIYIQAYLKRQEDDSSEI
ncbi:MAG: PAC2 family protein [Thermodesulfobacteriota bacterium]